MGLSENRIPRIFPHTSQNCQLYGDPPFFSPPIRTCSHWYIPIEDPMVLQPPQELPRAPAFEPLHPRPCSCRDNDTAPDSGGGVSAFETMVTEYREGQEETRANNRSAPRVGIR